MNDYQKNAIHHILCLLLDIDSTYHQAAVRLGVSDSVSFVLYMLHVNGGACSLSDIYRLSGISKQTVNSALRKLEREGIVYLEKLNGKAKQVCLSEAGKGYAEKTAGRLFAAECRAFGEWTQEELGQFIQILEKYGTTFKKQIEEL